MNYALILSGGSGTRLWPLSRRARPKHLIRLAGGEPLLEQTLDRLNDLIDPAQRFLITIPEQAPIVRDSARGKAAGIIIEPVGRNNLLPMALSTRMIADRDPDACIVFLPADHSIGQPDKLKRSLRTAFAVANEGYIVTLGIPTRHPEPAYGHIQKGDPIPGFEDGEFRAYDVKSFREKPPLELAEEFAKSDEWDWNGGIFIYSTTTMLDLIQHVQPELMEIVNTLASTLSKADPTLENPVLDWAASPEIDEAYKNLPPRLQTSIDYALIEKADKVATIPVDMDWNDLGGFAALADLIDSDDDGNRIIPKADGTESRTLLPGCKNTAVFPGKRTIICLDCEDLIVVESSDALLILPRESSAKVREVVDRIIQRGWNDLL